MVASLKRIRNVSAEIMARTISLLPCLEKSFVFAGKRVASIRSLASVYRETRSRLCRLLSKSQRDVREFCFGDLRARFSINLFTTYEHYFLGRPYESETTRIILDQLKPGGVFVDVGANHGFFTIIAGLRVGSSGSVYAFEPNPAVLRQLERHVEENGLQGSVHSLGIALSNEDGGTLKLFLSQDSYNSGLSSILPLEDKVQGGQLNLSRFVQAPRRSFDAWAAGADLRRIDLMKIDVEGAEELVLDGMVRTLKDNPPGAIIIETTANGPAFLRLVAAGYAARYLDTVGNGWNNYVFERRSGN